MGSKKRKFSPGKFKGDSLTTAMQKAQRISTHLNRYMKGSKRDAFTNTKIGINRLPDLLHHVDISI